MTNARASCAADIGQKSKCIAIYLIASTAHPESAEAYFVRNRRRKDEAHVATHRGHGYETATPHFLELQLMADLVKVARGSIPQKLH